MRMTASRWIFAAMALSLGASAAMAVSSYLTAFNTLYPSSTTGTTAWSSTGARCNVCHSSGGGTDLNGYGAAWATRHNAGRTPTQAFQDIEGMDSDGSGGNNIAEINANAQPGWRPGPNNSLFNMFVPTTVTLTGQNPPTTLAGNADPVAAPTNQPPVLNPIGAKNVNEGQLLSFTATATDPDGNALTFSGSNLPTGATVSPAGLFSWTPTFAQSGNYNVTITVIDNGSPPASDFETFTITVGNVNRPPVLGAIGASQTANEGELKTITITATDPDGDTLTFAGSNLPTGASVTNNGSGSATFAWTPSFTQAGSYPNVTITVTDNGSPAQSASAQFTITVANVNRPPVLAPIGNRTVSEGQTLAFTATATDPDGDALGFSGGNLPSGATLTPAGAFSWTPAAGQAGNYNVTITVTDNGTPPQNDFETFTITVGTGNRPPTLNPIGNKTVNEGQTLAFTATASDPDGGTLTFSAGTTLPAGASLTPSGAFSWTPGFNQAGNYSVTITVSDGTLTASETFTITVGNVNRPPVLSPSPIGNRTVTEGQTLTIAVTASDPDGGTLVFSSANLPSGATLVPGANGAATFSWTPAVGQAGTYSNVTITVSDGAATDSEIFTITVTTAAVNRPPVLTNPGNKTVIEGQLLAFSLTATDPDGNSLTFASVTLPTGATLSPSGAFRWTPAVGQAGTYSVTVTVTDNGNPPLTSAPQTFTITVQASTSTATSVRIEEAEWERGRLKVEGKVKPGGLMVTILEVATGKTLGMVTADKEGEWEVRIALSPAPCAVQARAGGQLSAPKAVEGAPRSCRSGTERDDDDSEDGSVIRRE